MNVSNIKDFYNLNGQHTDNPKKGIYIQGNKKYFIK